MIEAVAQGRVQHRRHLTGTQGLPGGVEPQPLDDGMQGKPQDARKVALQGPRRDPGGAGHAGRWNDAAGSRASACFTASSARLTQACAPRPPVRIGPSRVAEGRCGLAPLMEIRSY